MGFKTTAFPLSSLHCITCHELKKEFKDLSGVLSILEDVSFELERGQSLAIVGRSGSGKTTLLNCLAGIEAPSSGSVTVGGSLLKGGQSLGVIFQHHHLLNEFTALENVCIPLWLHKSKGVVAQATHVLKAVGLGHRLHHKPATLSGGERQRVAIARAMVTNPLCVLADEPTGNLDPETANSVMEYIFKMVKEVNAGLILVTHDMNLARRADRCLRLEHGRLLLE